MGEQRCGGAPSEPYLPHLSSLFGTSLFEEHEFLCEVSGVTARLKVPAKMVDRETCRSLSMKTWTLSPGQSEGVHRER